MFSGQIEFEPSAEPTSTQGLAQRADDGPDQNLDQPFTNPLDFSCHISDRHQLRILQIRDAPELFALIDTNRDYLREWLSWLHTTQTVDDTKHFIRQTRRRARNSEGFAAAICYDNAIAGIIDIHDVTPCDKKASIGYWLAQSKQSKGLMSNACKAVVNYSFQHLNLNRISILCATGNSRSQAIPKRLGFNHEGTLRDAQWLDTHFVDHEVYSLLRREWTPFTVE